MVLDALEALDATRRRLRDDFSLPFLPTYCVVRMLPDAHTCLDALLAQLGAASQTEDVLIVARVLGLPTRHAARAALLAAAQRFRVQLILGCSGDPDLDGGSRENARQLCTEAGGGLTVLETLMELPFEALLVGQVSLFSTCSLMDWRHEGSSRFAVMVQGPLDEWARAIVEGARPPRPIRRPR